MRLSKDKKYVVERLLHILGKKETAYETCACVAMANPPAEGMGCSCAFSPMVWGENGEVLDNTIVIADEYYEGIIYAEFDVGKIRDYREREDLGKFRKPKAYKHWGKN